MPIRASALAAATRTAAFAGLERRGLVPWSAGEKSWSPRAPSIASDALVGRGGAGGGSPLLFSSFEQSLVRLPSLAFAPRKEDAVREYGGGGAHTHITGLLRNGATLPEAKELARHSDIKMTMRYTHIGMEDQAKAVRHLPWHAPVGSPEAAHSQAGQPADEENEEKCWERSGSGSGVFDCHNGASGDSACELPVNDETPVSDRGCRDFSLVDSDGQKWRRRESNPRPRDLPLRPLRA